MDEQSTPINPLLKPTSATPTAQAPTPAQPSSTEELGPKGYPRPRLEVTVNPDADRQGPLAWTYLDGKAENRHYYYERTDPQDLIRAKMRGYQVCMDDNVTTGFDDGGRDMEAIRKRQRDFQVDRPGQVGEAFQNRGNFSGSAKVFGDLVLMETSIENHERLEKIKHEEANAWKKPIRQVEDKVLQHSHGIESATRTHHDVVDDGTGKKVWGFPNNPLGK